MALQNDALLLRPGQFPLVSRLISPCLPRPSLILTCWVGIVRCVTVKKVAFEPQLG